MCIVSVDQIIRFSKSDRQQVPGEKSLLIGPDESDNLLSFLLRCGTRPYERGTNETRIHSCRFACRTC